MTTEQILIQSFTTQLTSTLGWKLVSSPILSNTVTSYIMKLTDIKYGGQGTSNPITETIFFTIEIIIPEATKIFTFNGPDYNGSIQEELFVSFMSGGYTPPPVVVGDTYQITGITLIGATFSGEDVTQRPRHLFSLVCYGNLL